MTIDALSFVAYINIVEVRSRYPDVQAVDKISQPIYCLRYKK